MKCWNCGKEMGREDGGSELRGWEGGFSPQSNASPNDIEYYNEQLGKYSDGKGRCHVAICQECYIDGHIREGA